MFEKILLAVDGSEDSNRAIKKTIELQKKFDSKVVVFHSVEHQMIPKIIPLGYPFGGANFYTVPYSDYESIRREHIKKGENILKEAKEFFEKAELSVETRLIEEYHPDEYIKEVVEKENFDLVILGCKGHHSKLKQVFLGTVATKVLNDTPCDVMVIR